MQQTGYIYNNEALASVALGYFLKRYGTISIAKLMLVLPFVLHNPTVRNLRSKSNKRSLEEFIIKHPECLINFNTRYFDFLPVSINTITILSEMGVLIIKSDKICYNQYSSFAPENSNKIGDRAKNMFPAIDVLVDLMHGQDVNSFYLKLKVAI